MTPQTTYTRRRSGDVLLLSCGSRCHLPRKDKQFLLHGNVTVQVWVMYCLFIELAITLFYSFFIHELVRNITRRSMIFCWTSSSYSTEKVLAIKDHQICNSCFRIWHRGKHEQVVTDLLPRTINMVPVHGKLNQKWYPVHRRRWHCTWTAWRSKLVLKQSRRFIRYQNWSRKHFSTGASTTPYSWLWQYFCTAVLHGSSRDHQIPSKELWSHVRCPGIEPMPLNWIDIGAHGRTSRDIKTPSPINFKCKSKWKDGPFSQPYHLILF